MKNPRRESERPPDDGPKSTPVVGVWGRRLLGWFLLISLAPLVVSNGLGYVRSEVIIESLVERFLGGIAELQASHVNAAIDGLARTVDELATRPVVVEAARTLRYSQALTDFLDQILSANPDLEAVYIFDEGGRILASTPLPPADLSDRIGPSLTPPHRRSEVRRDTLAPHYPHLRLLAPIVVPDPSTQRLYLGVSVNIAAGQSFLLIPAHTAGSVETIVVDQSGLPVFVSHPHSLIDYEVRFESPLLEARPRSFATYADRQGVPVVGTSVTVPGQPWRLVNEIPVSAALTELRDLRRLSLWLASVLAIIVVAGAWIVSARIVAPVGRLVSATRRLGSGQLSTRVVPAGRDEIGELGEAFNDMAATLQRTSARVDELHQRELERAAQLATVGELAAGVAHEIKNPIAGISGGMDLIVKYAPADPKLKRIIDEMRKQTSRIGVAVRDLLAFARPVEPQLVPTDVNRVAQRARTLVSAAADRMGISMREDLESGLPAVVADEELLTQCLVNLMVNAVEAAGRDGRVLVATRAAHSGVEVRVEDSGPGIPLEERDLVFKPFFTTKHQGTGLGLSITADIIEKHGGTVAITKDGLVGTTLTIWLPSREAAMSSPPEGVRDPHGV